MLLFTLSILSLFGAALCAPVDVDNSTTAAPSREDTMRKQTEAEHANLLQKQKDDAFRQQVKQEIQMNMENAPVSVPASTSPTSPTGTNSAVPVAAVIPTVPVVPTVAVQTPTGPANVPVGPAQPAVLATVSRPVIQQRSDETDLLLKGFSDLLRPKIMAPDAATGQLSPFGGQQAPTAANIQAALQQPQATPLPVQQPAQPVAQPQPMVAPQGVMVQPTTMQGVMDPRMLQMGMNVGGYSPQGMMMYPQTGYMPIAMGRSDQMGDQTGMNGQMMARDAGSFPINQYGGLSGQQVVQQGLSNGGQTHMK